jgi:hypothetical protein
MNKAQAVALVLVGAALGTGGERLLNSALAETGRVQSVNVWVARWASDGGAQLPTYAGRVCTVEPAKCVDMPVLEPISGAAFERFLEAQSLDVPRIRVK